MPHAVGRVVALAHRLVTRRALGDPRRPGRIHVAVLIAYGPRRSEARTAETCAACSCGVMPLRARGGGSSAVPITGISPWNHLGTHPANEAITEGSGKTQRIRRGRCCG